MSLSNDATLTMPVAPAYSAGGYGSNGSMWGGDWSAWIILFLIILFDLITELILLP